MSGHRHQKSVDSWFKCYTVGNGVGTTISVPFNMCCVAAKQAASKCSSKTGNSASVLVSAQYTLPKQWIAMKSTGLSWKRLGPINKP